MNRSSLRTLVSWRWIGPVVVVAAIAWAGPGQVLEVLRNTNPLLVAAAVLLAVPQALLRGGRWWVQLHGFGVKIGVRDATAMYAMGMTLAAVTPGRVGDFAKILSLREKGCPLALAVACNVFDRVLDVFFVLLAGYGAMWYFSQHFASQLRVVNVVAALVGVAGLLIILNRRVIKRVSLRLVPTRYRPAVRDSWRELVTGLVGKGMGRIILLLAWTGCAWMTYYVSIWLCSLALGLQIPFVYLSACAVLVSLSSFLPVTVAGAGTRDAIFVLLLGQLGLTNQQSLALSALVLVAFLANSGVFYVVSVLLGGRQAKGTVDAEPSPEEARDV